MKKIFPILLLAVIFLNACRYEEPSFSLHSPEYRIIGYWSLQSVFKNEVAIDSVELYANAVGNYYAFFYDGPFAVTAYINSVLTESVKGSWGFQNNYKQLNLDFVLKNHHYVYTADIIKLSMREMKYEYEDEDGNIWRLEFYSRSHTTN